MRNSIGKFRTVLYLGLTLTFCFALASCSDKDKDKDSNAAAAPAATQKQKITTSVDRLMQWPEKDLRARASKAVIEQRWYKPPGNSALEYYLALKRKAKTPDEAVDTAIMDILPYAVIGMDQAVVNFNDREALRLEALIRMADPSHPALARLKSDIEKMKIRQAQAELEKAAAEKLKLETEAKAREVAIKAKEAAVRRELENASKIAEPAPVQVSAPSPPVIAAPAPVVVAPPPVVAATQPTRAGLVPLNTPQPEYPREALAAGTKGQVVAEITINGAGEVSNVRIISASPRNVFDKTVLATVRRWKYQGNGESTTIRRTFVFN